MSEFLRDPIWAFIEAVIAFLTFLLAVYVERDKFQIVVRTKLSPLAAFLLGTSVTAMILVGISLILGLPVTPVTPTKTPTTTDVLPIESMPFYAGGWVASELPTERGWENFTLWNDPNSNRAYELDYSLPITNTRNSTVGIVFSFLEAQDITDYKFIEVTITFRDPNDRCSWDMRDITEQPPQNSALIGNGVSQDISVLRNGNRQTFTIPLNTYFGPINRKVIQDMGCSVNTDMSRGSHTFTINEIRFLRQ